MTETSGNLGIQPVAGSLSAVVIRACQDPTCPQYQRRDCTEHARTEDLGVIASFDQRKDQSAHGR